MRKNPELFQNGRKRLFAGLAAVAVLLLMLLSACLFLRYGPGTAPARPERPAPAAGGEILKEGEISHLPKEELERRLQEIQRRSNFTVYVFPNGTISAGSRELSLTVGNLKENTASCFFELLADGEPIYTSPTLRPDERIERMTLDRPLPPGEHSGVVRYWLSWPDGGEAAVEVETRITCE